MLLPVPCRISTSTLPGWRPSWRHWGVRGSRPVVEKNGRGETPLLQIMKASAERDHG